MPWEEDEEDEGFFRFLFRFLFFSFSVKWTLFCSDFLDINESWAEHGQIFFFFF